jgi:hypothetical protein
MLAPLLHILPLTTIVRERLLPVSGTVLARVGQKVSPTEVVAQATWAREHVLIDVANPLRLSPAAADRYIRCKVGDVLPAGAEVAVGRGFMAKTIRTPKQGRVVAVGGGEVLLETGDTNIQLRAGMPGTVVQTVPDRGVIIQNYGSLIQGIWGNGRIETGLLVNAAEQADGVFSAARLDVSLRGSILLAGICRDREALEAAAELPVRGLIFSSMDPTLIPLAAQARFPILLTEGFGSMPMNSAAYRLLSTNVKREVTLNAEVYDRYTGARPEIFIPLPVSQEPALPRETEAFEAGQTVRMRRPPAMGGIGTLISLPPGHVVLTSGLRAAAAEVKMESGETVVVPLVNIEVLG